MYKGQLEGFPTEIVEKMLEKQVEQGNKKDVTIFEECNATGFIWNKTIEGQKFWEKVINYKQFDVFFNKYPKQIELPKVFCIMKDADNLLWNKYITWLNKIYINIITGCYYEYYGVTSNNILAIFKEFKDFGTDVQVLTLEQWYDLFIKPTIQTDKMEKEIIGYKLIKPEYGEAVLKIEGNLCIGRAIKDGQILEFKHTESVNKLKAAGVLDLWFEPVYKSEFKVGDWIICETAPVPKANLIIEINDNYYKTNSSIINPDNAGYSKKLSGLRLATKEEINIASQVTYTMGKSATGTFQLVVKDGKVFHKTTEDITEYVREVQNTYGSLLSNKRFGSYDFTIQDMIISKSGCRSEQTWLSQWLAIKL